MRKLIELWIETGEEANFGTLNECLEKIDRYDVIDDINESLGLLKVCL